MKKRIAALNLSLFFFVVLCPITALAASIALVLGLTVTTSEFNEDGYTFTPSSTGLYKFSISATLRGSPASCGDLVVYDDGIPSDHRYDGYSYTNGWKWTTFTRTLALEQGKTYSVKRCWDRGNGDEYKLSVNNIAPRYVNRS